MQREEYDNTPTMQSYVQSNYQSNDQSNYQSPGNFADQLDSDSDNENPDVPDYFENEEDELNLKEIVRRYCLKHHLTTRAVEDLVRLINNIPSNAPKLPKAYKTIMETPKGKLLSKYVAPGEYYHFGFDLLSKTLAKLNDHSNLPYELAIHIDGVALTESSKLGAWCITGYFKNHPKYKPFLIGVYVGYRNPADFDLFLEDLANDIHVGHTCGFNVTQESDVNGSAIETKTYFYKIKYIVADAPARSKITHTLSHNAAKGCPYCSQIGFKEADFGTQFSPVVVIPLRTDEGYNRREDPKHYQKEYLHKKGVLENIGVKMVDEVVPCAMHTFDLGTMKKILIFTFVKKGWRGYKFMDTQLEQIDKRFESLREYHPSDFTRNLRSIQVNIKQLKAVECRYILNYYGHIIFKEIFPDEMYQNFLYFSMATRLLSDPTTTPVAIEMAQKLLEQFVLDFSKYYGYERTYVVHTLLHFTKYVQMYGPLYSFSSYVFENYYREVKRLIRAKNHKALVQIRNRIMEHGYLEVKVKERQGLQSFQKEENDVALFNELVALNTVFKVFNKKDCYAMIHDDRQGKIIVKILKFKKAHGETAVATFDYQIVEKLDNPNWFELKSFKLNSQDFDIFLCKSNNSDEIHEAEINKILYKMVASPLGWNNDVRVLQRLIHTAEE